MISCLLLLVCALTLEAVQQFPALVEVEAGSGVRLHCNMNGMPATYCYTIIWTKIEPKTMSLVSFMNTAPFQTAGASAQTECSFGLQNATANDSGTYYCLVVYGKMIYIGNGSKVIVTQERKTAPPPIEILLPPGDVHGPFAQLVCVIPGVLPQAHVSWVIDGREKSGTTESIWTEDGSETVETTQNRVLVPAEQWMRGVECTCVVEFEGRRVSKSVQNGVTDYWGVCYATVAAYRVVVTALCLLSWVMVIAVAICVSRKQKIANTRNT
ncbi:uncharacterized protein LOC133136147 [Conger conger]|uniref:uncharacterized protein LOC133136147 n=1 Tax=Conger conger TaxID=82655 RepID=UPI002A59A389|nr:uncharacterized protein LOC133136147 [Conger conger]